MIKIKTKGLCVGCDSNFYNRNNPMGIKECWHFKDAEVVFRYCIGWWTPQNRRENFDKVWVLNCYTQTGSFAYYDELPEHLMAT